MVDSSVKARKKEVTEKFRRERDKILSEGKKTWTDVIGLGAQLRADRMVMDNWFGRKEFQDIVDLKLLDGSNVPRFVERDGSPTDYQRLIVALGEAREPELLDRVVWEFYRRLHREYRHWLRTAEDVEVSAVLKRSNSVDVSEASSQYRDRISTLLDLAREAYQEANFGERLKDIDSAMNMLEEGQKEYKLTSKVDSKLKKYSLNSETDFWKIIQSANKTEADSPCESIEIQLSLYKAEEILRFDQFLRRKLDELNNYDLAAIHFITQGGSSDDTFLYFRAWIVLQGKKTWELAAKDPTGFALKRGIPNDAIAEELLYVAERAYAEVTSGKSISRSNTNSDITGNAWRTKEELRERFPKVWARYIDLH